jgi:plastocyanin
MEENQTGQSTESKRSAFSPNLILIGVVVVIFAIFGFILLRGKGSTTPVTQTSANEESIESPQEKNSETSEASEDIAQTINIEGGSYYFKPDKITVKVNQPVKIVFKNVEGFHDFVLDEFNAKTDKINANQTAEVSFTPDQTGTFEFYCSVGNHRAMGMKGTLVVE